MADNDDIVVDKEVREDMQSVVVWEQLGLFRLDGGLGDGHMVHIEEVDQACVCDQQQVMVINGDIADYGRRVSALL